MFTNTGINTLNKIFISLIPAFLMTIAGILNKSKKINKLKLILEQAGKKIKSINHLIYITYPILKDERLFAKIIERLSEVLQKSIEIALIYEHYFSGTEISRNFEIDYPIFRQKKDTFNITEEEIKSADEILLLNKKHKLSPMEFVRKNTLIILENNLTFEKISQQKLKDYLFKVESILKKVEKRLDQENLY